MLSADRGGLPARDVAQGPGDLGFATTGAKRRTRTLEEPSWALLSQKERAIHRITRSLCENKPSARRDSNPRPRPWQGRAPPTEPLAHYLVTSSVTRIIIYDCFSFVNYYFANFSNYIYYCKNSDYFALTAVVSSPACYSPVH